MTYRYKITATDPDGDSVRFAAPVLPVGAQFDASTGQLVWTPTAKGTVAMAFTASDGMGYVTTQQVALEVFEQAPNLTPEITSTPPTQGFAYQPFTYAVKAFDPDNDAIRFELVSGPQGMAIDARTGNLTWTPTRGGLFPVELVVRDSEGATVNHDFTVEVWADDLAPLLVVSAAPRYAKLNEPVVITVDAQDSSPVPVVEVLVDGVPVTLDSNKSITTTFTQTGRHEVLVRASDAAGNLSQESFIIGVSADGSPTAAPVVAIHNVVDDEVVTIQKPVRITVTDDDLLSYRLSLIDAGDRSTEVRSLRVGSAPVVDATVGMIDATSLINGYHLLRLTATDAAGHVTVSQVPVKIDGGAKVGLVQLSFVDAEIATAGMNLQIARSYDSRRAEVNGDFGYGWELDIRGPRVRSNRPVGEGYGVYTDTKPFSLPCQSSLRRARTSPRCA